MVYAFEHPALGLVYIVEHPTSRRISARWNNGRVKLIVPRHTSEKYIVEALDAMAPRLLAHKPGPPVVDDIVFDDWRLVVSRQSAQPSKICMRWTAPEFHLQIGTSIDTESPMWPEAFNRIVHNVGRRLAPSMLFPRASQLAASLGCHPVGWKISHGNHVLGHCNQKGEIALSYINVFLPPHLRDYIICHELAHLSHMNHSADFHALCDRYLGGREKQLIKELRNYKWPLTRK